MPKRKTSLEKSPSKKKQHKMTTIDVLFARQRENDERNAQSFVSCPICELKLPESKINRHLDEDCRLEYLPPLPQQQMERHHDGQTELLTPKEEVIEIDVHKKPSLEKCKEMNEKQIHSSVSRASVKRNLSLDLNKCNFQTQNIVKSSDFLTKQMNLNNSPVISQSSNVFSIPSTSKNSSLQDERNDKDLKTESACYFGSIIDTPNKLERTLTYNKDNSLLKCDSPCRLSLKQKQTEMERLDVYKTPEKIQKSNLNNSFSPTLSPRTKEYLNLIPKQFTDIKISLSPTKSPSNWKVMNGNGSPMMSVGSPSYNDSMRYYLRNFLQVVKSVLDTDDDFDLFDQQDLKVIRSFFLLSVKAQKLYVRLFTRKHFWIPSSKMNYPEIDDDLEPVLKELQQNDLMEFEDQLTCLKTILKLLMAPQLKELCKTLNMKNTNQKSSTENYILNVCLKQKSAVPGHDVLQAVTKKAKSFLKRCCRLLETPRRVFTRVLMLYSLTADANDRSHEDRPFQLETILRVNMGLIIYPPYEINRRAKIFRSRDDLVRYEKAYLLDGEIMAAIENKDWDEAENLCSIALEDFRCLLRDETIINHDANLPKFLRKFTAGHVYVLCLNQRIELLQKLRNFEEAINQLEALLQQNFYCRHHRGHWFERIALNLEQHLHKPLEALKVIQEALVDPSVTMDHRWALHQRAVRISTAKKNKTIMRKAALALPPILIRSAPKVEIEGKRLNQSIPGYKTSFIATEFNGSGDNPDVVLCSVEEFALSHYRTIGFSAGLHGEGSTLISLFGLLLWDIIYQCGIPDAFRSRHQSFPLDLITNDFFLNRKENIEGRIDLILNSKIEDVVDIMEKTWNDHEGQSSLVNWNLFHSFKRVQSLVMCMGNVFLANICKRFAANYRHYRAGVPDIVIWKPKTSEWKMVEVKGPGDRLSNKQLIWLDYLLENEVSVEVCYVNAIGEKPKNSATSTNEK